MKKIAFIGPNNLAKMLRLQGIDTFTSENESEARSAIEKIFSMNEHSLVFITEALAIRLNELDQILTNQEINVMIISDNTGGGELSRERINRLVKFALGGELNIENG